MLPNTTVTAADLQISELSIPGGDSSLPGVQVFNHLLHRRIGLCQLGLQPLHLVCRRARARVNQLSLLRQVRCPSAEAPLEDQCNHSPAGPVQMPPGPLAGLQHTS